MSEFESQQKEVIQLLKLFNDNDVLPHVILIGSWAEYIYAQTGVLPGFTVSLRTIDVDFLVKNLRRPTDRIDVLALVKGEGYSIEHDTLMGTTKLQSLGGLEIEFLVQQKGRGNVDIMETNLGVNAQALRHLGQIVDSCICVNFLGMKVLVPCPEAYVLTKMIINQDRKGAKVLKDFKAVARLMPYINFDKFELLYLAATKKEKVRVSEFLEKYRADLDTELPLETRMNLARFESKNLAAGNSKAKEAPSKSYPKEK